MSGDTSGVRDSVVNQLLAKLDGVTELGNILVVGLTNQKDLIDDAMLRPGPSHLTRSRTRTRSRTQTLHHAIITASLRHHHAIITPSLSHNHPHHHPHHHPHFHPIITPSPPHHHLITIPPPPHHHTITASPPRTPGRLEVHLKIGLPDLEGRREILEIHTVKLGEEGWLSECFLEHINAIAEQTADFSGAVS